VLKCQELGLEIPEAQRGAVLAAVKNKGAEKRGLVTDSEFRGIIEQILGR